MQWDAMWCDVMPRFCGWFRLMPMPYDGDYANPVIMCFYVICCTVKFNEVRVYVTLVAVTRITRTSTRHFSRAFSSLYSTVYTLQYSSLSCFQSRALLFLLFSLWFCLLVPVLSSPLLFCCLSWSLHERQVYSSETLRYNTLQIDLLVDYSFKNSTVLYTYQGVRLWTDGLRTKFEGATVTWLKSTNSAVALTTTKFLGRQWPLPIPLPAADLMVQHNTVMIKHRVLLITHIK